MRNDAIVLTLPVIVLSAFVVSLGLAEIMRRTKSLRGLFGMKPRRGAGAQFQVSE